MKEKRGNEKKLKKMQIVQMTRQPEPTEQRKEKKK